MTAGSRPRKRFGQHFLRDPFVIDQILTALQPADGDHLVEIGPGRGALTDPLSRASGTRLSLIELDRDLASQLETRFLANHAVSVYQDDALRFDFSRLGNRLRLIGNLPYNISTPLLFHLLACRESIVDMHFMLQKEVVDRIAAEPGSKRFGRLTVMFGYAMDAEPLFEVPAEAFDPPPRVVSSVVRLTPKPAAAEIEVDEGQLGLLVTRAFAGRRKTLHNALKGLVTDEQMRSVDIDPRQRAEQIPVAAWARLANAWGTR